MLSIALAAVLAAQPASSLASDPKARAGELLADFSKTITDVREVEFGNLRTVQMWGTPRAIAGLGGACEVTFTQYFYEKNGSVPEQIWSEKRFAVIDYDRLKQFTFANDQDEIACSEVRSARGFFAVVPFKRNTTGDGPVMAFLVARLALDKGLPLVCDKRKVQSCDRNRVGAFMTADRIEQVWDAACGNETVGKETGSLIYFAEGPRPQPEGVRENTVLEVKVCTSNGKPRVSVELFKG